MEKTLLSTKTLLFTKPLLFIINPYSGKTLIRNKLLDIVDTFIKGGYQVRLHVTQAAGEASRLVEQEGAQWDLIVCSGGDGTLNETISGMMALEKKPILGYIPAGSTNDYASSLKISKNMLQAASDIVEGNPYLIDIGRFCSDRYFVYIAAFGAFTEVAYLTPQNKKNRMGYEAYMLEGVKSLAGLKSYALRIDAEDQVYEGDFLFGMITNTMSVGGFKGLVTQNVSLNDGFFEVLLVRTPRTPLEFSNIISYMFLKEETNAFVHKFKTRSLKIVSKEAIDWVLDGEFGGSRTEVQIENLEKQIRVMRNYPYEI